VWWGGGGGGVVWSGGGGWGGGGGPHLREPGPHRETHTGALGGGEERAGAEGAGAVLLGARVVETVHRVEVRLPVEGRVAVAAPVRERGGGDKFRAIPARPPRGVELVPVHRALRAASRGGRPRLRGALRDHRSRASRPASVPGRDPRTHAWRETRLSLGGQVRGAALGDRLGDDAGKFPDRGIDSPPSRVVRTAVGPDPRAEANRGSGFRFCVDAPRFDGFSQIRLRDRNFMSRRGSARSQEGAGVKGSEPFPGARAGVSHSDIPPTTSPNPWDSICVTCKHMLFNVTTRTSSVTDSPGDVAT